jgi:hypothetical protein
MGQSRSAPAERVGGAGDTITSYSRMTDPSLPPAAPGHAAPSEFGHGICCPWRMMSFMIGETISS